MTPGAPPAWPVLEDKHPRERVTGFFTLYGPLSRESGPMLFNLMEQIHSSSPMEVCVCELIVMCVWFMCDVCVYIYIYECYVLCT
jgi:hypothetical protein